MTGHEQAARQALAEADTLLSAKGRTFHWARHLLGKRHADRATRLYGFCRRIDDLADEASSVTAAHAALASIGDALRSGQTTDPNILDALDLMRECSIDPAIMLELVNGVRADLEPVAMADDTALLRYCYRVAGTVGLMMCQILDVRDAAALRHAVDLGMAMQLTNICRDVTEDARAGRRYLPASMIGDVAPHLLIRPTTALQLPLRKCIALLLDRADVYYRSGEQGLVYLPVNARVGMLVAARVYQAIGAQLRRTHCAVWQQRAVVPPRTKLMLTTQAVLDLLLYRQYWGHPNRHDARLHAALAGLPHTASQHA